MTKDYYKILDIPEFSTQDEIKNAYRKLARKWHPDVAGSTEDVISKFKEINEAYEILSDRVKKADYDTARKFYNYANSNTAKKTTAEQNTTNPNTKSCKAETKNTAEKNAGFSFNWEEFVSKARKESHSKNEQSAYAPQKGENIYADVEITVLEAISGTVKVINMLQTNVCPKCGGRKFVNGSKCSHCEGKGEISSYKKFSVKIPAGVKNNSKIRLAEEGEKGLYGGKNGDLYLTVHIIEPKDYKTEGLNVLKTVTVAPYEAVLGANVTVTTLYGKVSLKIAPNTKNGQKIRLNGCGIEQGNKVGDMIVTVEIQIPKNLTNEEIELYKRLQDIASTNVREV